MANRKKRPTPSRQWHYAIGLHPVFLLALCSVGIVLVTATIRTFADQSYSVQATVQADPITVAASIVRPTDGYRTGTALTDVQGSCPVYSYVKLFVNDGFHGAAVCDVSGQFIISTTLSPGRNILMAQVYNLTDQPGPPGETVALFYDVPTPVSSVGTTPRTQADAMVLTDQPVPVAPAGTELEFLCECAYRARYVDDTIEIPVTLKGGSSPYNLKVNWGDGTTDTYLDQPGPVITITHTYKPFAAGLKAFTIGIDVTDGAGIKSAYQIYQLVRNTAFQPAVVGPALPVKTAPWLALLPAFAILTILIFVFWLGERHELDLARAQAKSRLKPRHRRHV